MRKLLKEDEDQVFLVGEARAWLYVDKCLDVIP